MAEHDDAPTWSSSATAWPAPARSRRSSPAAAASSSEITMFGDEPYGNYNRIMLSNVLAGGEDEAGIFLNPLAWYAENGITLHAGVRVGAHRPATPSMVHADDGTDHAVRQADHRHRQPRVRPADRRACGADDTTLTTRASSGSARSTTPAR